MLPNLKHFFSNRLSTTVGLSFLTNSFIFSSWITRLPQIQVDLQLSEGDLGFALLGMPLGSLMIMPSMGWFTHRFGSGQVTLVCSLFFCLVSVAPVLAFSHITLLLAFILVGLGTGSMDIAMNAAAAGIEKHQKITIMSTCHGLWSIGAMVGAASAGIVAGLEINPLPHIIGVCAIFLILTLYLSPRLMTIKDPGGEDKAFAWPTGPLLATSIIGFCVALGEGAMADWSAVYLRNTLDATAYISGFGFAGFAGTMALGRFYGDQIIPVWGTKKVVTLGCLAATISLLIGFSLPFPWVAIAGFTLAGIGFSCLIPAIFISAAHTPGLSSGTGIAAVASLAYFGMLAGPPFIGMAAEEFGLRVGLGSLVVILGLATLISWRSKFH